MLPYNRNTLWSHRFMINRLSVIPDHFVGCCRWFIRLYDVLGVKQANFCHLYHRRSGARQRRIQSSSREFVFSQAARGVGQWNPQRLRAVLPFAATSSPGDRTLTVQNRKVRIVNKGKSQPQNKSYVRAFFHSNIRFLITFIFNLFLSAFFKWVWSAFFLRPCKQHLNWVFHWLGQINLDFQSSKSITDFFQIFRIASVLKKCPFRNPFWFWALI